MDKMHQGNPHLLLQILSEYFEGYEALMDPQHPFDSWSLWEDNMATLTTSMRLMSLGTLHDYVEKFPFVRQFIDHLRSANKGDQASTVVKVWAEASAAKELGYLKMWTGGKLKIFAGKCRQAEGPKRRLVSALGSDSNDEGTCTCRGGEMGGGILAAFGSILARLRVILARWRVILAAFGGILARLPVILVRWRVIRVRACGRKERGGGGSTSRDSYHPRGVWGHPLTLAGYPRAVAGQPRAVAGHPRGAWGHPRAGRREEGKRGGERWREHIAGQLSSSRSLGASSRGCGSSSRVGGSSSRSLGASSRGCGSSSRSLGSSSRGPAGGRKEGEAVAHRGTVIILALLRVILARWRVVLAAFGGILAWLRAVLAELGVILVRACGRSSSRRLGASSRGCGSSSRSLGSSSRWPAGGRKWGEAGAHRGTVIILAASGGILARLQITLAFLWVILAAFGGILAWLRVILAELGVILAWAGGRRERGGGGSASKDSYHPRPRVVLGIPARLQASSRSFWHPRAGLGGEGKGGSHFGIYTSRGASSRGASSRGSSSRGSALRGSFLARIILARITLARIVLARVILSRVILALVILAWGILARAILVRVILALVILARVIFARVIIARIILARIILDPLDFLQKLLQDTPGKAALFLGVFFATKTVAWAGTVIIVSQCRGIYASRLWGANSPAAMAASAWRQHCPFLARRLDAAAARAAASRSSAALARLLGIPAADLAPAAAEGTIAFRFLWPLWFPVQCWAMIRWWPWPHPEDRGSLPRAEHAVADLTDARAEDIE
ncbi:unnamed protein product [Polarella glacialis]|uniref:Uncharacterized protein n=1 Tax=Polarella glacialis TaxID=89957 RepID=A0A813K0A6_POLGL|nr:unnamed protein product [Polarella glacialis]